MRAIRLLSLGILVAACAGTGGPSPSSPPASPSAASREFTLEVFPPEDPSASRMAIPGSPYVLLVVVRDAGSERAPVTIGGTATRATIDRVEPASLEPGVVGEVRVVADAATAEVTGSVTITGSRGGITHEVTRSLPVFPMADERAADARPYFDRWRQWLAGAHPELGITGDTSFEPVFVSTLLVVSHYAYWSEDWEMTVAWHNMIPPDDWTEVHLRRRGVDTSPSIAWRQDSVHDATEPHPVEPPAVVVR